MKTSFLHTEYTFPHYNEAVGWRMVVSDDIVNGFVVIFLRWMIIKVKNAGTFIALYSNVNIFYFWYLHDVYGLINKKNIQVLYTFNVIYKI